MQGDYPIDQSGGGGDWFTQQIAATPASGMPNPYFGNPGHVPTDPTQAVTAPPTVENGGVKTGAGDPLREQIAKWAAMPGADPSLASNPDYWVKAISDRGGLTDANRQYWQDASVGPTAFFNHPEREQGGDAALGTNQFSGFGGGAPEGFGTPPAPYQSNANAPAAYVTPARTGALANQYATPTWQGGDFTQQAPTFSAPTMADLQASPGYQSRLDAGLLAGNRSAAAHGTVLNGGTQKALNRYGQDYASNEYNNLFNQGLATFGTKQTGFLDAFDAYKQKYNQFQTGVQNDVTGRGINENAYQTDVANGRTDNLNQFGRYQADNARTIQDYLTNAGIKRTAETDYWGRQNDVANRGLSAALGSRVA